MANIEIPIWYKGEDQELFCQITENDEVTPIAISSFANIVFWCYDAKTRTVLEKYSLNVLADHNTDDFVVVDDANGQFMIRFQESVTSAAKCDNYIFEIKTAEADVDFEDGHYDMIAQEYFCHFAETKVKNLNISP